MQDNSPNTTLYKESPKGPLFYIDFLGPGTTKSPKALFFLCEFPKIRGPKIDPK